MWKCKNNNFGNFVRREIQDSRQREGRWSVVSPAEFEEFFKASCLK